MKRRIEALVRSETVGVIVVMAACLCAAAAPAQAVAPVAKLRGEAWLTTPASPSGDRVNPATFHVDAAFSTDTPDAEPFTVQQAVIFFPDHAGTNGRLFPSCSAQQIERFNGNVNRCPKGSKLGTGTVRASAIQLGITATGHVTLFNGPGGKSITLNIQTYLPAYINESLDAPITQLHGKYGEKLTLVVPHSLQEIIPDVFVGVQDFDVTISGAVRRHGVDYSFLKARTCPKLPIHGVFDFKDWTTGQTASTTVDSRVRCSVRAPAGHASG